MILFGPVLNLLLGGALGFLWATLLYTTWRFLPEYNPIPEWLMVTFAGNGQEIIYYALIYTQDFVINSILAIPVVLLLKLIVEERGWSLLGIAIVTFLTIDYWSILSTSPLGLINLGVFNILKNLLLTVVPLTLVYLLLGFRFELREPQPVEEPSGSFGELWK